MASPGWRNLIASGDNLCDFYFARHRKSAAQYGKRALTGKVTHVEKYVATRKFPLMLWKHKKTWVDPQLSSCSSSPDSISCRRLISTYWAIFKFARRRWNGRIMRRNVNGGDEISIFTSHPKNLRQSRPLEMMMHWVMALRSLDRQWWSLARKSLFLFYFHALTSTRLKWETQ